MKRLNVRDLVFTFTLSVAIIGSGAATAMGDGGGSSSDQTSQKCKTGMVWSKTAKKCVKANSGIVPDQDLYEAGRALALAGKYEWAIDVLNAVRDQHDPAVLNYLGYAHRKAGMIEAGIAYYQQALAIDPDYLLVREYLGEGYVAAGKVELARQQLNEIAARCGTNCEEYQQLAEVIAATQI
jgi:tetratricopeptide (TPR) repeat protein